MEIVSIKPIALFISMALLSSAVLADTPKPRHDWTGFYAGGFVGGGGGAHVDSVYVNYRVLNLNPSVMGGATIGYNWHLGRSPWVVGLEGEYGYGVKGEKQGQRHLGLIGPIQYTRNADIGGQYGYGVIGGRLGYAYDRSLFYVKSGAVFANTQFNASEYSSFFLQHTSGKSNDVGYAIGGGIEQALPPGWFKLAKNVSIKAEYLYLGTERTQRVTGQISYRGGDTDYIDSAVNISGIHTAKIGINYRFRGL